MMNRRVMGLWMVVLMAAGMVGCGWSRDNLGLHVNVPAKQTPSTSQSRIEKEYIPNAARIRLDTRPKWPNGRYAFQRGAERLLVISRITSIEDEFGVRYDKYVERVWITLPLDVPVGQRIILEKLESEFAVGYEEGDGREMYIHPVRVLGNLTILEELPDESVLIEMNMSVYPGRLTEWRYVDTFEVPMTPDGYLARSVQATEQMLVLTHRTEPFERPPSPELVRLMRAQQQTIESDDSSVQPGDEGAADGDKAAVGDRSIVGRWSTKDRRGWAWEVQFEPDGIFIYSSQRAGYPAYLHYGDYVIKEGYVVFTLKTHGYNVGWRTNGPKDSFAKFRFNGEILRLDGTINHRGEAEQIVLNLRPAGFSDKRFMVPDARKEQQERDKVFKD